MIIKEFDNYDRSKLEARGLPIFENVKQLLDVLCITEKQEILFFSKNGRKNLYRTKEIPKKHGGKRTLKIPVESLKIVQKAINNIILCSIRMSDNAHAYIKKKSIVTNAVPHISAKTLIKIDIKDFFPSINLKHVFHQFRFLGYGENVSKYLAYLCVDDSLNLPQGAPTSPAISNLISLEMDKRIKSFCDLLNLKYTRYADDITISSKARLIRKEIGLIKYMIYHIFTDLGFEANNDKFKVFSSGQRMSVTGVVINDKLSIPKAKKREIENAIRYIKKYGLKGHLEHLGIEKNNYVGHLYGLASFIKMIDKEKGEAYFKALNELNI